VFNAGSHKGQNMGAWYSRVNTKTGNSRVN